MNVGRQVQALIVACGLLAVAGAAAGPLTVTPDIVDAGPVAPGSSAVRTLTLANEGAIAVRFEFPGLAEARSATDLSLDLDAESFGPFVFRPASAGPVSGTWTGFSGQLDLLISAGATWTNDLTVLLTSTPELDLAAVVYQVGGNSAMLVPADRLFQWVGGVGNSPIEEAVTFAEPIAVDGLYAWVGNSWSSGSGQWDGNVTLTGLGGQTGLITAIDPQAGELAAGVSVTVEAVFESGNRAPGTYTESLILLTDQAEQPEIAIPVSLTVPGFAVLEPLPSALDFGEVLLGASADRTLLIENSGNVALSVEQIAVSGNAFAVSESSLLVAPASSALINLRFEPDQAGPASGSLSFVTNAADAPEVVVALSGFGLPAPAIALDPAAIALTLASGDAASVSFDIVNNGDSPLEFTLPRFADPVPAATRLAMPAALASLSGDALRSRLLPREARVEGVSDFEVAADFAARGNGGYELEFENFSAAAGEFVLVDGPLSGSLSLVVADFVLVSASGQTWANDLTVLIAATPTPDLHTGNDVLIQLGGSVNALAPIVGRWGVGNSGAPGTPVQSAILAPEPFELNEVYLFLGNSWLEGDGQWSGSIEFIELAPTAGPISAASPASGTVGPGDSVPVTLDISAVGLVQGDYVGLLQVASNDPLQPTALFELALAVTGTPALDLGETNLDFGELFVGQQRVLTLPVTNTGTAPLTLNDFSIGDPAFAVAAESVVVEPGEVVAIPVRFTAAATGTAAASLGFQSNDPANPSVSVALSAVVLESPALIIEPAAVDAALQAGADGQVSLTLSNPGSAVLSFDFSDFGSGPGMARVAGLAGAVAGSISLASPGFDQALAEREAAVLVAPPENVAAPRSDASFQFAFEAFEADGLQFVPVATGLSGSLTRIDADFVLDQSTGVTWASDLSVVITEGPDFDPAGILLQAGGTITLSLDAPVLRWNVGNNSMPGTVVQTSLALATPLILNDAHVWIGNAWAPGDSGQWTGAIGLDGVTDRVPFVVDVAPASGELGPGASTEVNLALTAEDLIAGVYRDRLVVVSNDPLMPAREVPVTLTVTGEPALEVSPDALDFGEVFVGATANATALVRNIGTDVLEVDAVTVSGEGFASQAERFTLVPGASAALAVTFSADAAGSFSGELALGSNAGAQPALVSLAAEARDPGILTVSDSSLTIEVAAGATATGPLTLGNIGASALAFEAAAWQSGGSPGRAHAPSWPALQFAPPGGRPALAPRMSAQPARAGAVPRQDREVLWEQPPNGSFRITSSRSTALDAGLYAADLFDVDGAVLIQGLTAYGFRFDGAERFDETFERVVFLVYADDEGRPAGHPDDGLGNELFRAEANVGSPGFSVSEQPEWFGVRADVSLDLVEATGAGLLLGEGRYWLLVHAVSASPDLYTDTWEFVSSFDGNQLAHIIDPENVFQIGAASWLPLASVIPAFSSNLAFKLEGRALNFLSVDPPQGVIGVGDSLTMQLLVDATNFEPGSYIVDLVIRTDSPATPEAVVTLTMVVTEADRGLNWVNLAGPAEAVMAEGARFEVHGRARIAPERASALATVEMWAGFHHRDIHPALWPESAWVAGTLNELDGEEAAFVALAGDHLAPGHYHYATRFRLADGSFVYGGYHMAGGGFWNGLLHVSGRLTIEAGRSDALFSDRFVP